MIQKTNKLKLGTKRPFIYDITQQLNNIGGICVVNDVETYS